METKNYLRFIEQAEEWFENGMQLPEVGQFIYGLTTGLKGDHGKYKRELSSLSRDAGATARLIKVTHVVSVDDLFTADFSELIKQYEIVGGCESSDVDLTRGRDYTDEELASVYTLGAVIVDKSGRWFILDPEGYSYSRYFYSVPNFEYVFEEEIAQQRQEEKEQAERAKAEYQAELDKHAAEYAKTLQELREKYSDLIYHPDSNAKIRSNVIKFLKKEFPDKEFIVKARKGYYSTDDCQLTIKQDIHEPYSDELADAIRAQFKRFWSETFGRWMPIGVVGEVVHDEFDGPYYTRQEELTERPMQELFGRVEFWGLDLNFIKPEKPEGAEPESDED
jgi:hypothetical protein